MTIRRLNFTGCQRIHRSDVVVSVDDTAVAPSFTLAYSLDDYAFPGNACVVVEAQAHWTLMRFNCGTIDVPSLDRPFVLEAFDVPDGIIFRLKVIGTGNDAGLILGEADRIRPADCDGRDEARSLLAVQPADLGQVVWRLSFAGPVPLLQINERIADWRSFMRRTEVKALLVPELYRQLLREAQRNMSDAEAQDTWQAAVLAMVSPAAGLCPSATDDESVEAWIDDAVRLFAGKHKFLRALTSWTGMDE